MRLVRYKRNRGVYKCQTFGTLQMIQDFVESRMFSIYILIHINMVWAKAEEIKF